MYLWRFNSYECANLHELIILTSLAKTPNPKR
ncbi:MAG: hypothetical protein PWQ54_1911, partial [Bacteroidales bacterium]|nr:hypothetical protein [Bacteroidales bacterium]